MSTKYEKIANDEGIDHSRNISTARFCDVCKFCFLLIEILITKIMHTIGVIIY